ncbi:MAG: helix-turn-helix domain-containing protein [Cyanobacteriota bacterium]|jgi:transcriptional regulator with XRE-family HTH domain|nr:helix-turn-helix domain-containing protein [Cyanobacteriota bacterium]
MPARLRHWLRRGRKVPSPPLEPRVDPLLLAGRQLREHREARGLSLRQLALNTRISTPVLEALERGWRDRLPEPAYLRTMLPLIEQQLELRPGSLEELMPAAEAPGAGRERSSSLRWFMPGSIEVFRSWQGTVLYALLSLALIYALNLEQQRRAAEGLLALKPIAPLPASEQIKPAPPEAALLRVLPELRPLEQAVLPRALRLVGRQPDPGISRSSPERNGVLVLRLRVPTRLVLSSPHGSRTDLQSAQGELVLPLEGGFQLRLDPPPPAPAPDHDAAAPAVEWNGSALAPLPGSPPGRYGVGTVAGPRP